MPKFVAHLTENEIKMAVALWVDGGCRMPDKPPNSRVRLSVSQLDGNDPREIPGPLIEATVEHDPASS